MSKIVIYQQAIDRINHKLDRIRLQPDSEHKKGYEHALITMKVMLEDIAVDVSESSLPLPVSKKLDLLRIRNGT